jgi:hypothetical protein
LPANSTSGSASPARARGALPPQDVAALARRLSGALAAVHAAGLVHGEVHDDHRAAVAVAQQVAGPGDCGVRQGHQGAGLADTYAVRERIGRGGLAEIYRVRHRDLRSDHAAKILRPPGRATPPPGSRRAGGP